jgi:WD40 repeat protein
MLSQIVYDFEAAHQRGDAPAVGDFVPRDAVNRTSIATELVRIDLEYRRKRGLPIRLDSYLQPLPELAQDQEVLLELIEAECRQRQARGEPAEVEGYARRFPALAGRLATLLGARTEQPSPSDELPKVPGYEDLRVIKRGGMGVVYRARQAGLRREVALKMLLGGDHAGPDELARFRMEAEAVGLLGNPHIVQIYEVGQCGGQPFFSMELMDGSLADRIRAEPLPRAEAAGLVEKLARTMHAVHRRGILHRDLKPANVLLASDGTPKITDFGLAKRLDHADSLAASGAILGTPAYMAPEQAQGKSRARVLGPAVDVYALGAILYELLTGRPPFEGATLLEILKKVVHEEPAKPSWLRAGVPRDLDTICLKCLAKEPHRRYPDALALAEDLRRFQTHEPISARPVGRAERLLLWARRRPMQAALCGLALLVLVLGSLGGAAAWLWQEAEKARQETTKARDHLAVEKRLTEEALHREEQANAKARKAYRQEKDAKRDLAQALYLRGVSLALAEWRENEVALADKLLRECDPEQRNWEWDYVNRLCHSERLRLTGHAGEVWSVCFRPDGKCLATASEDRTVKLWDAATGRQLHLPAKAHNAPVTSVCFSPDGKQLASGSANGTVKVWDAATGREPFSIQGHTAKVFSVTFSPDSKRLATASEDKTVKVWNAQTGKELFTIGNPTGAVCCACFSHDSALLASTADGPTVKVWDATTGNKLFDLESNSSKLNSIFTSVCFSRDGKYLASGSRDASGFSDPSGPPDNSVRVWDLEKRKELLALRGHTAAVNSVCFSADGKRLASAANDRTVKVWDVATGQEAFSVKGHTDAVNSVCFSYDGKRLASASSDRTVKVWDAATRQEAITLNRHFAYVYSVCFSPDGKRQASAGGDNRVTIWDAATGGKVHHVSHAAGEFFSVCFSPDGKWLATASQDCTVKIYNAASRLLLARTLRGHSEPVTSVCFGPDGKWLASASQDCTIRLWPAAAGGQARFTLQGHKAPVTSVCFSPDGKWLASASEDQTVKIWDVGTHRVRHTLKGHTGPVNGVCFSPAGKSLASASSDETVKIWNWETGQEVRTLREHNAPVQTVSFHPTGTRLASGSGRTVMVWDAATGKVALTLNGHTDKVSSMCFSPDGRRLATASFDWTVKIWDATPPAQ